MTAQRRLEAGDGGDCERGGINLHLARQAATDPEGRNVSAGRPPLRIVELSKNFGAPVLRGVTFDVPAGRITALLGANGAGKTTIFNIISGFVRPEAGAVWLGELNLLGRRPHELTALGVGRTFQDVRMFPTLTVLENVLVGLRMSGETAPGALFGAWRWVRAGRHARLRALEQLEFVGLDVPARRLASQLSFGQQRRLGLARALVSAPQVLLLDEPTAGLDPAGVEQMVPLVRRLADANRYVLLIEHDKVVVERAADLVVFLDAGTVLASGDTQTVLTDANLAQRYLGV